MCIVWLLEFSRYLVINYSSVMVYAHIMAIAWYEVGSVMVYAHIMAIAWYGVGSVMVYAYNRGCLDLLLYDFSRVFSY